MLRRRTKLFGAAIRVNVYHLPARLALMESLIAAGRGTEAKEIAEAVSKLAFKVGPTFQSKTSSLFRKVTLGQHSSKGEDSKKLLSTEIVDRESEI